MQQVKEEIIKDGHGLYGLVNNAGVGGLGLYSTWTSEELHDIFAVNVYGPVNLVNIMLPLLLEDGGRVVNIGSQGGMITKKYFGPYSMTKHDLTVNYSILNNGFSRSTNTIRRHHHFLRRR